MIVARVCFATEEDLGGKMVGLLLSGTIRVLRRKSWEIECGCPRMLFVREDGCFGGGI